MLQWDKAVYAIFQLPHSWFSLHFDVKYENNQLSVLGTKDTDKKFLQNIFLVEGDLNRGPPE